MSSGLPILRTCEEAFAYLANTASISQSLGLEVLTGIDNLDKTAPCVICFAESSTEDFPFSGIHHVRQTVMVKQMAADSSTSSSVADGIFLTFMNANTKAGLNHHPGFFCYEYWIIDSSNKWEGDAWHQSFTFDVVSALS